jgi:hypothetical protein
MTGTISGVVLERSGTGLAGVEVETLPPTSVAITGADGTYSLADLPAGTYSVKASRSGFVTVTRADVALAANGSALVDFTLLPQGGRIGGRVLDARRAIGIAGAQLTTVPATATATTGASGTFELAVPIGTYQVVASAPSFRTATAMGVLVRADATTTVDLNLEALVVFESTCLECHLSTEKLLADLSADPPPEEGGHGGTGEG